MTKKKIIKLSTGLVWVGMLGCSQVSAPAAVTTPAKDIAQPSDGAAAPNDAVVAVDSKEFLDTFVDTQNCIVNKEVAAIAKSTAADKPKDEEIAKMTKVMEEKARDESNKNAAWQDLKSGCNESEVGLLYTFFQCQNAACTESDAKAAEEKHRACTPPESASEGCKKSFGLFIKRFAPF